MSYAQKERSVNDGSPVELYSFHNTMGTWNITSAEQAASYGGTWYTPQSIKRTAYKATQEMTSNGIDITIEAMNDIIYSFSVSNTVSAMRVELKRLHRRESEAPDLRTVFKGTIASIAFEDEKAVLKVLNGSTALGRRIPRIVYQTMCNHVPYSPYCGVNKELYKVDTDISLGGDGNPLVMHAPIFSTLPENWLRGGYVAYQDVISGANIGQQLVMIVDHNKAAGTITVLQPLRNFVSGVHITAYAGCDRKGSTCVGKFGNIPKFVGWEYMPLRNPFGTGGIVDLDGDGKND